MQRGEDSVVPREPAAQTANDEGMNSHFWVSLKQSLPERLVLGQLGVCSILQRSWRTLKRAGHLNDGHLSLIGGDDGEVGAVGQAVTSRAGERLLRHLCPTPSLGLLSSSRHQGDAHGLPP